MTVRVLVVDDDFRVAAVHAAVVERVPGCVVAGQATSLAQARALLSDPGADLVIADQYLPDGLGLDLVGAADASVLLVTAADDAATVQRALVRGVIGYVVKPFGLAMLADRIGDYVRFRDALDRLAAPDQAAIDGLCAMARSQPPPTASQTPKGRSAVTNKAVADLLRDSSASLTAVAVADAIGISRATAQRYLSDLVEAGHVVLSLRYGTAGRPEHSYSWARR